MNVHKLTFNPFQENTYILTDETKECVIIDPGCYEKHEQDSLAAFIEKNGLKPVKLLNTHCHIDHVLGNYFVASKYNLELEIHEADLPTLQSIPSYAHVYGFEGYQQSPEPSYFLTEGEKVSFGKTTLDIIFAPGHAPGHVVFYNAQEKILINGDVLFQGSFGRVDLPGGDFNTLRKSITEKIFTLPDETLVYTGHGGETTVGQEKETNPILHMQL